MFIAIYVDAAGQDSRKEIARVINEYGVKKVGPEMYESYEFLYKRVGNLKRDLTKCMDMDDRLRIYQYPVEDLYVISIYNNGKWKKLSVSK
jgi:CRISPR-associated protein Cas2